jgi:hypothetical protein
MDQCCCSVERGYELILHRQDGSESLPCLTSPHPSFNYLVIQLWRRYVPYLHKTFCCFRFASHYILRHCDAEWKEIPGHSYSSFWSGNNLCLTYRRTLVTGCTSCCNVCPADCTGVFLIIVTINNGYFPKQHKMAGICNRDAVCSLWRINDIV